MYCETGRNAKQNRLKREVFKAKTPSETGQKSNIKH